MGTSEEQDTRRAVRTQGELDRAIRDGDPVIDIDSPRGVWLRLASDSATVRAYGSATVRASGSATVEASDSATVRAYGSATVRAYGSATVEASDSATVRAYGSATVRASASATVEASASAKVRASGSATVRASDSATVRAYGSATVRAYGSATVEASGSATVRAYGSATVRAYGSATVEAYGSATVEASDSATVRAYGSATVRASGSSKVEAYDSATVRAGAYVSIHLFSALAQIQGGVLINMTTIDRTDPRTWCDLYGVPVDAGRAIVYKYVDSEFGAGHAHTATSYRIGASPVAADWARTPKCGRGLHFGHTPRAAKANAWRDLGADARWVEVTVDLDDAIAVGDKLKARSCTVVREVDVNGEPVAS